MRVIGARLNNGMRGVYSRSLSWSGQDLYPCSQSGAVGKAAQHAVWSRSVANQGAAVCRQVEKEVAATAPARQHAAAMWFPIVCKRVSQACCDGIVGR